MSSNRFPPPLTDEDADNLHYRLQRWHWEQAAGSHTRAEVWERLSSLPEATQVRLSTPSSYSPGWSAILCLHEVFPGRTQLIATHEGVGPTLEAAVAAALTAMDRDAT